MTLIDFADTLLPSLSSFLFVILLISPLSLSFSLVHLLLLYHHNLSRLSLLIERNLVSFFLIFDNIIINDKHLF